MHSESIAKFTYFQTKNMLLNVIMLIFAGAVATKQRRAAGVWMAVWGD